MEPQPYVLKGIKGNMKERIIELLKCGKIQKPIYIKQIKV